MAFRYEEKQNYGMKVGIIGASAAGLYTAILVAKRHPDYRVVVLEKNDKAGKKLLATGNGHCNLFNLSFSGNAFNHPEFVNTLLNKYSVSDLLATFRELGISTIEKDGLLYPLSFSAAAHVRYLVTLAESLGVQFRYGERVVGINGSQVTTDKNVYSFDKLVYTFGGKSQANLGSDGSMFLLLSKKGYHLVEQEPSLCPLKSPEVPKSLFGIRHKCELWLTKENMTLYHEIGEVLFKKDGLSGIAIMNASSRYEKGASVRIDLFPELNEKELYENLCRSYRANKREFLAAVLEKPLEEFILQKSNISCKTAIKESDISKICSVLKSLQFRISEKYDFESSQVTRGGIDLREVGENLESKLEPNVFFAGECLDIDGLCGGYNLGWVLLSSKVVAGAL